MKRSVLILFCLMLLSTPLLSNEQDEEESLFYIVNLNNRFELKRNYLNSEKADRLRFSDDSTGYYFYAGGTLMWFASDELDFNLSLDSGQVKFRNLYYENGETKTTINDEDAIQFIKKSLFVEELYFEYDGTFGFEGGKANRSAATDFVFNDYVFFVRADLHLYERDKKRLSLGIQYNTIDGYFNSDYKGSPMISLDLSYKNGKKKEFSLFSTLLYDRDNAFAKVYEPFVESYLSRRLSGLNIDLSSLCSGDISGCISLESSGYIIWNGFELKGNYTNFHYRLDGIVNYGNMDVYPYVLVNDQRVDIYGRRLKTGRLLKNGENMSAFESGSSGQSGMLGVTLKERKLLGYMVFAEAGYKFADLVDVSPFFLFMSGESDFEKSGYLNSFVSVKSYITLSDIFFNGGLNETASSRTFSMAGVNGAGIVGAGLWIKAQKKMSPFELRVGVMKYFSSIKNSSGKMDYGTELDLITGYSFSDFLELNLEADYFIPGDFFEDNPEPIKNPFKLLFGLNLFLDNMD